MKNDKNLLSMLLRYPATVLTFKDISLIWRDTREQGVVSSLAYYVKKGELLSLRRGIYAKDKDYNRMELATKIYTPAYISFETALTKAGMIFQYYGQIFVASYQPREISCDGQTYCFRKLKSSLLTNPTGIEKENGYAIACPERAFLDMLYLYKNYYFDNLRPINWQKVAELLPIYENKELEKRVKYYQKEFLKTI